MCTTEWPFSRLHHVHIIVENMEQVEAFLGTIGIRLSDYDHPGEYTQLEGDDPEALAATHYKFARIGDIHFQFMSPKDDRPSRQNSFVKKYGSRVYSIGFLVDDVDAAEAAGIGFGLRVLAKGRHQDGWGFTYFDTFDDLGVYLTVRQNPFNERAVQAPAK